MVPCTTHPGLLCPSDNTSSRSFAQGQPLPNRTAAGRELLKIPANLRGQNGVARWLDVQYAKFLHVQGAWFTSLFSPFCGALLPSLQSSLNILVYSSWSSSSSWVARIGQIEFGQVAKLKCDKQGQAGPNPGVRAEYVGTRRSTRIHIVAKYQKITWDRRHDILAYGLTVPSCAALIQQ